MCECVDVWMCGCVDVALKRLYVALTPSFFLFFSLSLTHAYISFNTNLHTYTCEKSHMHSTHTHTLSHTYPHSRIHPYDGPIRKCKSLIRSSSRTNVAVSPSLQCDATRLSTRRNYGHWRATRAGRGASEALSAVISNTSSFSHYQQFLVGTGRWTS